MILDEMSEIEILALTILGESRGEPIEGQIAVGCIIQNRCFRQQTDYKTICFAPKQFSCWNDNDPNRDMLIATAEKWKHFNYSAIENQVRWVAQGIFNEMILNTMGERQNYMTLDLFHNARPKWARDATQLKVIKNHIFFHV